MKLLVTLLLWSLTVLAARYRLGVDDWPQMLARLSTAELVLLILCIPVAALLVQFFDAFYLELNTLVRGGGVSAARSIAQVPTAIANISKRAWREGLMMWRRWDFANTYRRRLLEDYGIFNDRGLGLINAARLDLEKVYVDLQISNQVVQPRGELLLNPLKGRQPIWHFLRGMRPGEGLVLLGSPGSGKTTLLQYLLLVFASGRHRSKGQPKLLPIFVELRLLKINFSPDSYTGLASAIREYWHRNSRIADLMKAEPPAWLEDQLYSGRVLLLLDGMDEVPQLQRADVARWINSQIREYRACRFVVTSRPGGYIAAPLSDPAVLEIQPFTKEQINQFIDGWYLANEIVATGHRKAGPPVRRRAADEANDLRRRLRDNANLQDLTVNPLLLTMVCMVHRYHGALPGSRAQLYGEICQVLLERWRQGKEIHDELTGEQKLSVLRPLAHEYMRRETREIDEDTIVAMIDESLAFVGYKKDNDADAGARFLRAIQFGSGLMLEKEAGIWSFAHKTFQEYLTSEYWLRDAEASPHWATYVAEDWWRESLLLYAARADASDLVEASIATNSAPSWALGFQCLNEAHSMRPDVRRRAEAVLRQALHSSSSELFMPAARSMHYLRQSQVRRISDTSEQRVSLVSQAEYQLFLNELSEDERELMIPPHWTDERFVGDPETPILGVWPWQAETYAKSASRGAFSAEWRLPSDAESIVLPNGDFLCWLQSASLASGARDPDSGVPEQPPDDHLPEGLNRNIHVDLRTAHTLALAIGKGLRIAPHQKVDVASALAASLNVAIAHTFGLDTGRSHELAHIASFDKSLVLNLIEALKREQFECRELYLNADEMNRHSVAHRARLPAFLQRVSSRGKNQSSAPVDRTVWPRRQNLLAALEQLVDRQRQWSSSAHSWRNYARCLLTVASPYLTGDDLDDVLRLGSSLRLLNERECGQAKPREGILLVRDAR